MPRETAIVNEQQRANHPQHWNPVTDGSIDIGKGDVIEEGKGVPTPYSPSSYLESSGENALNAGRTDTDDTGTYSNQMKTGALTTSTSKYIDLRPSKPHRDDKSTVYPCKVDLIIAIDYQPNINANRDQTAKLVARMIKNWTISVNKTRIAIVSYGLDDGVGIYTGAQAQDELLYSLESGGYTFGVIYTLSR
ncbi:unnamed protein product [Anisakis simplex]|uniref:VWFA domain-containing protein n=1 Tax=Anisakis simplex TaxID=6269 RepID=A0A3P6UEJ4_ANISI|nr:unnamed protein product [Anisakis simplex]